MRTFKAQLYEICDEVSSQFSGWSFVSGQFKNRTLKHTDLVIDPGFGFERGTTPVQPSVCIDNKRAQKLCKYVFGANASTSIVNLQTVSHLLQQTPEELRLGFWIVQDRKEFLSVGQPSQIAQGRILDITEARCALIAMMQDGIAFIDNHYELGSEDGLLKGLPAKYTTRHVNSPYDQMEKFKGVMVCIAHILYGDFDFVERYQSDDFNTLFPKRTDDLDRIIAKLPEFKKRFAETGIAI
ncbi:hypothetical protein [Paraburkholderia sp. J11-2]|uniref:hypothetical protein n=1 Tax=Paraburkholderia sp. J11-2 TaxID=2805431 RepID=UPI002AB72622|nr:hypothetical protein [Paraburkholderia sp. J11-2]